MVCSLLICSLCILFVGLIVGSFVFLGFCFGFRVNWWDGWVSGLAGGFVLYLLWVFGFRDFLRGWWDISIL